MDAFLVFGIRRVGLWRGPEFVADAVLRLHKRPLVTYEVDERLVGVWMLRCSRNRRVERDPTRTLEGDPRCPKQASVSGQGHCGPSVLYIADFWAGQTRRGSRA